MQKTDVSESDQIEIRSATLDDAPVVTKIWLQGLEFSVGKFEDINYDDALRAFRARILAAQGSGGFWVAVAGQGIVGWQSLTDLSSASKIVQSSTYIDRDWHRHGLGKRLLTYAQDRARKQAFNLIVGCIKTDNTGSIKLVTSLGWHLVGVLPRHAVTDPELAYYAYAVPKPVPVG